MKTISEEFLDLYSSILTEESVYERRLRIYSMLSDIRTICTGIKEKKDGSKVYKMSDGSFIRQLDTHISQATEKDYGRNTK